MTQRQITLLDGKVVSGAYPSQANVASVQAALSTPMRRWPNGGGSEALGAQNR